MIRVGMQPKAAEMYARFGHPLPGVAFAATADACDAVVIPANTTSGEILCRQAAWLRVGPGTPLW